MIGRLHDPRRVHAGALFDVVRATLDGHDVAIKRHVPTSTWRAAIGSVERHWNPTFVYVNRQVGWEPAEPPAPIHFEALLHAEHAVLEHAAEHWNHPGTRLARWQELDGIHIVPVESPGTLCLIMPWCRGHALASLSRADQRRWFPAMLPALWRALAESPHGDLSPDDLLLDREAGVFRILDPGVRVSGPSHAAHVNFSSDLFTTNAPRYPLITPEHGPGRPRVMATDGGLAVRVESERSVAFIEALEGEAPRAASPGERATAPTAADVIACGAIYYEVLAGAPLMSLLGLDEPLWSRAWSDRGTARAADLACIDALAHGAIPRALTPRGVSRAEIALCERLVLLALDDDALARCVVDATRAIT